MTLSIFCPLCQRKNEADATHCIYCGVQFVANAPETFTTTRVTHEGSTIGQKSVRCKEQLTNMQEGSLALFVLDKEEPIIIENVSQVVVGRHVQNISMPLIDLTNYGAVRLGVSRRHIQISFDNDAFTIVDMGSTNGTWVNQQRLAPGRAYELHSDDLIMLGQLIIQVCFRSKNDKDKVEIQAEKLVNIQDITLPAASPFQLTPRNMTTRVNPYLQAIFDLQQISDDYQGKPSQRVNINSINAVKQKPILSVSLEGAEDAVRIIQEWVIPWMKEWSATKGDEKIEKGPKLQQELNYLASSILDGLSPHSPTVSKDFYYHSLMPLLTTLTTSNLLLMTKEES